MKEDAIVNDIRAAREKLFRQCHEDVNKLMDWFKKQERQHKGRIVSRESLQGTRSSRRTASSRKPK